MVSQLLMLVLVMGFVLPLKAEAKSRHRNPAVGEVDPIYRKKANRSSREPAILNLNDELERLSELNQPLEANTDTLKNDSFIKNEAKPEGGGREFFFNKYLIVDEKILLFGDQLTGVLNCKASRQGHLVVSDSRQINTKTLTMPPGSKSLEFKDGKLCESALAVFKNDPQGESRLIVVEAESEKITRFDIR